MDDQPMLELGARTWGSLKDGDRVHHEGRTWVVQDLGIRYRHCDRCDLISIHLVAVGEITRQMAFHVHANEEV